MGWNGQNYELLNKHSPSTKYRKFNKKVSRYADSQQQDYQFYLKSKFFSFHDGPVNSSHEQKELASILISSSDYVSLTTNSIMFVYFLFNSDDNVDRS